MLGIVIIVVIKKFVMGRKEREKRREKEETIVILTHRNTVGQSDRHHMIASLGQGGGLGRCSRITTGRS